MGQDTIQKTIRDMTNNLYPWWIKSKENEKKVVGKYGQLFNPANLKHLTKEDFKSFLLIKNNLHWEGIHRRGNDITSDMGRLKKFLKLLLNEDFPIGERMEKAFSKKGGYAVKWLGRAIATPILLVVYPSKYCVWNKRSESALKKLRLLPRFSPKDSFADKYLKVNQVLLGLANEHNITLWQLDIALGEISGSRFGVPQSEEEVIKEEAKEHGVADLVNFGMESHLEDFLIANWSKTAFGKKYELIEEEGDLVSQQYSTSVGSIDILARSKGGEEYLVIELKKGRSSDAVVGQILRYIAWVRENLAKDKTVKGVIVVLELDEKLKYALKELKNIILYTYQVNFRLTKESK